MTEEKNILLHRHFDKIMEGIQDYVIILLDEHGTILTWNQGVEKIKGFKKEEIIGQNIGIFYLPQDRQAQLPQQLIETAKREGSAKHVGKRIRKNGTTFWGSILITAIKDENDKVMGFTKLTRELAEEDIP